MIYNIIVEPEAVQDLIDIKTHISKDSLNRANSFISELKDKIKTLQQMPQRCRESLYTLDKDTHDLIHKGYTIVYKIINDNVHILTIFRQRAY